MPAPGGACVCCPFATSSGGCLCANGSQPAANGACPAPNQCLLSASCCSPGQQTNTGTCCPQDQIPLTMLRSTVLVTCVSLMSAAAPLSASAQPADACATGLVWREGFAGDHLCVSPEVRAEVRAIRARCERDRLAASEAECKLLQAPSMESADPFGGVTGPRPFLIIAPYEFIPALEPLVAHKNTTGMPTLAVSIAQLTSRFAGVDDAEKIKRGIQYAHEHLGVQYVMLVGDPHWFPVRFIFFRYFSRPYPNHPNERNLPVEGTYAPSDLYYANLYHHRIVRSPDIKALPGPFDDWDADHNGRYNEADWGPGTRANWNEPNPDHVDGYPDVAVARAIAHSVADVTTYVNKVIRYETQRPQHTLFTFVADGLYRHAPARVDPILARSHLNVPAVFLQTNKPDPQASARWPANAASPDVVASKINSSVWVGYLGHGSLRGWDGRGFGLDLVKLTAQNDLPVVFVNGCVTGRFAIEAPFDSEYVDVTGAHHRFVPAPGADPNNPSIPAMTDRISGQTWGDNCPGCNPLPLKAPPPNPYDFDRPSANFAYPWLFGFPQGGAIAYFGEVGILEPQMAAELETYMLADYARGERNLGAIYLQAEREYWKHHIDDPGVVDHHSPSRLYLGFMVMFGDPTLRMH